MNRGSLASFAASVEVLCRHAAGIVGGLDDIHLVLNPAAGGLRRRAAFAESRRLAEAGAAESLRAGGAPGHDGRFSVHITDRIGHGRQVASDIAAAVQGGGVERSLVITAGGDGTHEEVMAVLAALPSEIRERFIVHRLPMGTGNDAPLDKDMGAALATLSGARDLCRTNAVRVATAGGVVRYSFNIASLGVDAYVTDMSNRLKSVVPGDIYRSVADVSVLFYEPIYKVRDMRLGLDGNGELSGQFLLVAMGISGHRSYGDGKKVLPGPENLCAMRNTNLKRRLALRRTFYEGGHVNEPEAEVRSVQKVVVNYDGKIPLQFDGESLWLEPGDFPLTMTVEAGILNCLRPPA